MVICGLRLECGCDCGFLLILWCCLIVFECGFVVFVCGRCLCLLMVFLCGKCFCLKSKVCM